MESDKIKSDEIKKLIKDKLTIIYNKLIEKNNRVIFEMVMYSSFKEMIESFLILCENGYELGASALIRTMYETILWYEARFSLHPNDVEHFDIFLTGKQLSEYRNKNGKKFTFSSLHKNFVKKINLNDEKENKQLDDLYKYLNGYTHISQNHINKMINNDNQTITMAIPPLGTGTKLKYNYNQLTIVYFIVSLYELCVQIFDEK
jgi:hypothetical protein